MIVRPWYGRIRLYKTVENVLRQRTEQPQIKIFSEVEPNPSTNTVYKGQMMVDFQPDTIIALGGGSAMDAKSNVDVLLNTLRHHSSVLNKSS